MKSSQSPNWRAFQANQSEGAVTSDGGEDEECAADAGVPDFWLGCAGFGDGPDGDAPDERGEDPAIVAGEDGGEEDGAGEGEGASGEAVVPCLDARAGKW